MTPNKENPEFEQQLDQIGGEALPDGWESEIPAETFAIEEIANGK